MATLKYLLDVAAPDAKKTFDQVGVRLADLDKSLQKTRDLSIGDVQAMATFTRLQAQADRLKDRISGMPLTIEGAAKAEAQLLGVEATADRLDRKLSGAGTKGGILGLLGKIGGAAGTAGPAVGPVGIGAAVAGAAAVAPAAIPYALGTGLGGLGAYLAAPKQFSKAFADMVTAIKADLQPLRPLFASVLGTLPGIVRQLGPGLRDVFAYSVPYLKAFVGLITPVSKIILPAIAQILREMLPNLPTISKSLLNIAQGFAMFLDALGPRGIQASAKIIEALSVVIEAGLAGSGAAANALAVTLKFLWNVIGTFAKFAIGAFEDFAKVAIGETKAVADFVAPKFDELRHHVANTFDGMRHDIANVFDIIRHIIPAAWDAIWSDSTLQNTRGVREIRNLFGDMQHGIASVYDTIRHDIASAWDLIWNNTIGRVSRGIGDVVTWFRGLPGKVVNALAGLGSKIYSLGHGWLIEMGNGIKAAWDGVMHWLEGLPGRILHALGIHSPPSWAIDAGKHIMGGITKGLKLGVGDVLSFVAGVPGRIGNLAKGFLFNTVEPPGALARFGNAGTGAAGSVMALAQRMAASIGWTGQQWNALNAVEMAEAGWNLTARNPSSGAYGIAQFINGPGEYAQYGGNANTAVGQITAFFNYIRQRYGTPAAAAAHENAYHWYGGGLRDGLFTRPTIIGVGDRPGGERVSITPANQASAQTIVLEFRAGAGDAMTRAVIDAVQNYVTVHGGDAQVALGQRT